MTGSTGCYHLRGFLGLESCLDLDRQWSTAPIPDSLVCWVEVSPFSSFRPVSPGVSTGPLYAGSVFSNLIGLECLGTALCV